MKIDLAKTRAGDKSALAVLMKAVKRAAGIACSRVGADNLVEDVAQETAIIFLEKLIHRFDADFNVEPILIETARLEALTEMRKRREIPGGCWTEEGGLLDIALSDISICVSLERDAAPVADRCQQKALQEIKEMFPGLTQDSREMPPVIDTSKLVKRHRKAPLALSPENARLKAIRLKLGISQEQYAYRLNVTLARIQSYEYGRTSVVPQFILSAAEKLLDLEKLGIARRESAVDLRPMSVVVVEWARMAGVTQDEGATKLRQGEALLLADILGVSKSTVLRWSQDKMTPNARERGGYIRLIQRARQRATRAEASGSIVRTKILSRLKKTRGGHEG